MDQSEMYYTINDIEQSHIQALGDKSHNYGGDDSVMNINELVTDRKAFEIQTTL